MATLRKAGLDEAPVEGATVLLRVDFNVPLDAEGRIRDDSRIRAALPTIQELLQRGAAVVLVTHLGRPKGHVVPALSTEVLAERLRGLIQAPVATRPEVVGERTTKLVRDLRPGQLLLLENVRFMPEEEANDPVFARQLAALATVYVNDAFGSAHRAHASTEGVTHFLPAYAGRLMAKELEQLGGILDHPKRPLLAIMGGSKLSTKLGVINHLLPRIDGLCLGGAMAATFLEAQGVRVGRSLVEEEFVPMAHEIQARSGALSLGFHLPIDAVVAPGLDAGAEDVRRCPVTDISNDEMLLDIGEGTAAEWEGLVPQAGTVVWNGPLGVYERPQFSNGTRLVAESIAKSQAISVTGGGDLQAALDQLSLTAQFTHVSTGGGATLEFLEGRELPGVVALLNVGEEYRA